jgi:hypothetical protein
MKVWCNWKHHREHIGSLMGTEWEFIGNNPKRILLPPPPKPKRKKPSLPESTPSILIGRIKSMVLKYVSQFLTYTNLHNLFMCITHFNLPTVSKGTKICNTIFLDSNQSQRHSFPKSLWHSLMSNVHYNQNCNTNSRLWIVLNPTS